MTPTNLLLLMTFVSFACTVIAHSLSADGAASVLDHFGVEARLPKATVYVAVLVCTFGSGLVDAKLGGADWGHALFTAGSAFIASVFGAAKQHAAATKGILIWIGTGLLVVTLNACAAILHEARNLTVDTGKCLTQNQDLSDEQAFIVCGIQEASQRLLAKEHLHTVREETTKHAHAAANIAAHEARLGCSGGK